jgi:hypothetical protein
LEKLLLKFRNLKEPLEPTSQLKGKSGYRIMSATSAEELSQKVSHALMDGTMHLHGHPFVFNKKVCQAIKFLAYG